MEIPSGSCFTYILECGDGSLYTGWTVNLEERLKTHNSGAGARYTRSRLPVKLLASWSFETKSQAMALEYRLKQLSRDEKLKIIQDYREHGGTLPAL